ncbi:MAG: hypothetical protein ACREF3_08455 [Acetobacteraceae bacterium]
MNELVKVDLDGPGASYVNARLDRGGVLSRLVLRGAGCVNTAFSPLPPQVGPDASHFERGGITTYGATLKWLVQYVECRLPDKSGFCFLVDGSWSKATDPAIHKTSDIVLLSGMSVIHALPGTDFDETGFKRLFHSVNSFEYSGFLVAQPLARGLERVRPISDNDMTKIALHVSVVTVGAFDREGLIISELGSA